MDFWKWAVSWAVCLTAVGCRTPQTITALERECRMLEDQIYQLEDELAKAEQALEACQGAASVEAPGQPLPSSESRPRERGPKAPVEPGSLRAPQVEIPGEALPPGEIPKTLQSPTKGLPVDRSSLPVLPPDAGRSAPSGRQPGALPPVPSQSSGRRGGPPRRSPQPRNAVAHGSARSPASRAAATSSSSVGRSTMVDTRVVPAQAIALDPRADNTRVSRITLNRALTGGYERDARFGDAGVTVLVEPRDAQGQVVAAPAPISVVVLDRGLSGEAARVARWDFTAEQTAALFRKTPYGEGFYLEMPWPGSPPVHSQLHLFVRYTTQDGRNLEASHQIQVALPAQRQQTWVPLSSSGGQPEQTQTAGTWHQKTRRHEETAVQPAVAEQTAFGPSDTEAFQAGGQGREFVLSRPRRIPTGDSSPVASDLSCSPKTPASATPNDPATRNRTRPVWSPNRPNAG